MTWLESISTAAIDRMPSKISARNHAKIDYALAAITAGFAIYCLQRNKTAAVAGLIAAAAGITTVAMTGVPGGLAKAISFPLHGRIEMGNSAILASMPRLMGFAGTSESKFFYGMAAAVSMVIAATDFTGTGERDQSRYLLEAKS